MEHAADCTETFDPYVSIPGGPPGTDAEEGRSSTVRALLMDRAVHQIRQILSAVKRGDLAHLPPVLRGLDQETRGALTQTVAAMLAALQRFLTDDCHADARERLDPVLRPIGAWVRGRYAVTSPALLVIQSILYSHCEWFRDCLWEAHSAERAYSELLHSGYPEDHCRLIAAILAHQTLARTSWTQGADRDPREALAYVCQDDPPEVRFADEPLDHSLEAVQEAAAQAIGASLFDFLAPTATQSAERAMRWKRRLAAALVLHALCLHARHHGTESASDAGVKDQALRFFDFLIETRDGRPRIGLVFIQYGRYVQRANDALFRAIKQHIREHLLPQQSEAPKNITLCLHRVGSRNVWEKHRFQSRLVSPPRRGGLFEGGTGIGPVLDKTVGELRTYKVSESDQLRCVLGLRESGAIDLPAETRGALAALFRLVHRRHLACLAGLWESPECYFPTPLVGHVLTAYRHIKPQALTALHIVGEEPRTLRAGACADIRLTLWLPIGRPVEFVDVWQAARALKPEALVACYVAAMMVGLLVSFAPRRLKLDYLADEARQHWSGLIAQAFDANGGPLMGHYVEQIRALKAEQDTSGMADPWGIGIDPQMRARWRAHVPLTILGIDIGGTSIKAQLFQVRQAADLRASAASPCGILCSLPWPTVKGKTPAQCLESLLNEVLRAVDRAPMSIDAVGIAFAGPVADGVPVGVSRILQNFAYTGDIVHGNPHSLHTIDFADAARTVGLLRAAVVLLNDGDADIRSGETGVPVTGDGKTLVLKEGTGVACSLYEDGSPADHPCETAKAILNICCFPVPRSRTDTKPFQSGQLGQYVSKKKLATLLPGAVRLLASAGLDPSAAKDVLGCAIGSVLGQALKGPRIATPLTEAIARALREPAIAGVSVAGPDGTAAGVAAQILRIGDTIGERFQSDCRKCHADAEGVFAKRLAREIGQTAPGDVEGQGAHPDDPPPRSLTREWEDLEPDERAAVACAWVLGRWLADGIALSWDLYGMREVRLAGGPLSGATGIYIAQSARGALKAVYGFDLDTGSGSGPLTHPDWYASARRREIKALRLVDPPETSSEGGPRGAALAAFDGILRRLVVQQLKACRNAVANMPATFSVFDLMHAARGALLKPWVPSEQTIGEMLERESAALGLTRIWDGRFRRRI